MDSYYNQYRNQYKIYTAMSADKLASFRVDSQLWEQFQGHAKENNVTATALLISYIKSVVNTDSVIIYNPVVNTSSEVNNPNLSIQDIDKRIDDKIKMSIQDINALSIQDINALSIQDIDNRIKESIADGDIKEVITNSYEAAMGQFNGLLGELQELKKQFEELQSNPPAAVPSPQPPITNNQSSEKIDPLIVPNHQLPVTPEDVINFLGIEDILGGEEYWQEQLEVKGIDTKIKDNFEYFKSLGIEFKGVRDTAVSRFNLVLKWLGYKGEQQKTTIKQSSGVGVNKYIAVKVAQNDN